MADDESRDRWQRGREKFEQVYCGDVAPLPRGASPFFDLMMENLFCDVWTREGLDQRDRRMLMLGAIAALGESMTFGIQVKAALKLGELTPEQARETLIHLTQYVGYPRVAPLVGVVEQKIAEVGREQGGEDPDPEGEGRGRGGHGPEGARRGRGKRRGEARGATGG